jgi:hypothetical protein
MNQGLGIPEGFPPFINGGNGPTAPALRGPLASLASLARNRLGRRQAGVIGQSSRARVFGQPDPHEAHEPPEESPPVQAGQRFGRFLRRRRFFEAGRADRQAWPVN